MYRFSKNYNKTMSYIYVNTISKAIKREMKPLIYVFYILLYYFFSRMFMIVPGFGTIFRDILSPYWFMNISGNNSKFSGVVIQYIEITLF